MVGSGNNLWILSASDDDGGNKIKTLLQGQWHPMDDETVTGTDRQAGTSVVTYEVTGTGTVTSVTPSGISQVPSSSLPLDYSDFTSGAVVGLSIQNDQDFGSVSCTITAGGQVISSNTSSVGFGIAQCTGTVP